MADPPSQQQTTGTAPKFTELNDLACDKVGGKILFATDDWFAVAENLIKPEPAVWSDDFSEFGKWMDGWETRRKRIPGHDWCIIQLGAAGTIQGVDVDTSFFTGNYTPKVSIQAASLKQEYPARKPTLGGTKASEDDFKNIADLASESWTEILPMTSLGAGYKSTCHNYLSTSHCEQRWTHIRLNMYPDGGIARFRVYGQVVRDWTGVAENELVDLAAMLNGGICIGFSNAHYGHGRNLIGPGRAPNMGDGWETARRLDRPAILVADSDGVLQVPGCEWSEFLLGHPGVISKVEIDTNHFKGNYPDTCFIEGCYTKDPSKATWKTLLPVKKMAAHKQVYYEGGELNDIGVVSHVRITMAPDGGISRMRICGYRSTRE